MLLLLQTTEVIVEEAAKYGQYWYSNPIFGVATAALLIVVIVVLLVGMAFFIMNSQSRATDKLRSDNAKSHENLLQELSKVDDSLNTVIADLQELKSTSQTIADTNKSVVGTLQEMVLNPHKRNE